PPTSRGSTPAAPDGAEPDRAIPAAPGAPRGKPVECVWQLPSRASARARWFAESEDRGCLAPGHLASPYYAYLHIDMEIVKVSIPASGDDRTKALKFLF